MDDPGRMRGDEAGGEFLRDGDGAVDRQAALARHDRRQIGALHVRHRDVGDAVDLSEVVNADDVLVRDLTREQQLVFEAALQRFRGLRVRRRLGPDHLQRHGDFERLIPRLIDGAHAADAEQRMM